MDFPTNKYLFSVYSVRQDSSYICSFHVKGQLSNIAEWRADSSHAVWEVLLCSAPVPVEATARLWVVKAVSFIPPLVYLHFYFCSVLSIPSFLFDFDCELFSFFFLSQMSGFAVCLNLLLKFPNIRIYYCISHLLTSIPNCITPRCDSALCGTVPLHPLQRSWVLCG